MTPDGPHRVLSRVPALVVTATPEAANLPFPLPSPPFWGGEGGGFMQLSPEACVTPVVESAFKHLCCRKGRVGHLTRRLVPERTVLPGPWLKHGEAHDP